MTVLERFQIELKKLAVRDAAILIAVSTGCDSMVLLDLLLRVQKNFNLKLYVAYVDHQLRAQSQVETAFIKDYCQQKKLPLAIYTWSKENHPNVGVEAEARKIRYTFFKDVMLKEKIAYLATAHHADDQAETFLMKLLRGGEIEQLTAIKAKRQFVEKAEIIRPLLPFAKAELYAYAKQHDLVYFEDETNASDDYQRNRLRHHVIPALKAENSQVLKHIQSYSEQLSDLLLATKVGLNKKINQLMLADDSYSLGKFISYPNYWQRLCLKELFRQQDLEIKADKQEQVRELLLNLARPNAKFRLRTDCYLIKEYDKFYFKQRVTEEIKTKVRYQLELGNWLKLVDGSKVGFFKVEDYQKQLNDDCLELGELPAKGLFLRHRQSGDRLLTTSGRQKVKKIMIDNKLTIKQRADSWLLTDDSTNVYWILGLKKSDLSRAVVNAKIQYIVVHRS